MEFSARIRGDEIVCEIASETDLISPVFCFSMLAPARVVSGGTILSSVGGYCEAQLSDLAAGMSHTVTLAYADPRHRPKNRAWLPLGAYLRDRDGVTELPELRSGADPWEPGPAPDDDGLRLVPPPSSWEPGGDVVELTSVSADDARLETVHELAIRQGFGPFILSDGLPIEVRHDGRLGPEAYTLLVGSDKTVIHAADDAGVFYAGITLLNLILTHKGQVPTGVITDAPDFGWRGQHLDCARHFYQPETLLQFLDMMALLKLNRFHWHFSDDEAFRLEVECLPELWRRTAYRGEKLPIPGVFGGGIRSGGSYSKPFAQDLIARGRALNIEIMPEIEVPAHALAMNAVIDGLRDPDDAGDEVSVQGYLANTINPAMPKTWDVLEKLLSEVSGIFPFDYIQLGCDECPSGTWEGSPAIDRLKEQKGLETTDDVHGWMMHRLGEMLVKLGKKPAAWEEAARGKNGGIGHGALLFSWTGQGPGLDAARAGYDVVMCPAQHVYLDMARSDDANDWGATWAAIVPLGDTVNWQPVPSDDPALADRIKGVQGEFWGEFTTKDSQLHDMIWPRILGVSSMAWAGKSAPDGAVLERLAHHYDRSAMRQVLRAATPAQ